MKVQKLIELLEGMPKDFEVTYRDHRRVDLYDVLKVTQVLQINFHDDGAGAGYADCVVLDSAT